MTMLRNHRVLAALAAVSLLSSPVARAQTTVENASANTPYIFEAIDSYELRGEYSGSVGNFGYVLVTGVLKGESTTRTLRFSSLTITAEKQLQYQRCDRLALLAMTKPGRYYFQLEQPGSTAYLSIFCKLERR